MFFYRYPGFSNKCWLAEICRSDSALNNCRSGALVSFDVREPMNPLTRGEMNPCLSALLISTAWFARCFERLLHLDLQSVRSSRHRIILIPRQSSGLIKQSLLPWGCSRPASCLTFVDVEKSRLFSDQEGFFGP